MKPCPECGGRLSYLRNQTLRDGRTRYYKCAGCGAQVRVKPDSKP